MTNSLSLRYKPFKKSISSIISNPILHIVIISLLFTHTIIHFHLLLSSPFCLLSSSHSSIICSCIMLNIGHINICSLRNKIFDLNVFLKSSSIQYDILGISESRLNENITDNLLHIEDYHIYRKDPEKPLETGIAVYVKNSLKGTVIYRKDLTFENIECIWLEIITKKKKAPIFICILYRNGKLKLNEFYESFTHMLDNVTNLTKTSELIITGDFNIDLLHTPQKWTQTLKLHNLYSLINIPTRITDSSATCIDHIYTNQKQKIIDFGIENCSISDHNFVFCSKISDNIKQKFKGHKYISYRSMKNFNITDFQSDLHNTPFDNVYSTTDPDIALEIWYNLFISIVDKHAPLKKRRIKHKELPHWQNQEIINEMKRRDYLKRTNNKTEFKISKNKVKSLIEKSEKELFQSIVKNNTNKSNPNILPVWHALNTILNKKCSQKVSTNSFTANDFNNFFLSIPENLKKIKYIY